MGSENKFVYPQNEVKIPRSKFPMNHRVMTSLMHGDVVPLEIIEVVPGDTFKCNLKSLIRMPSFIAPLMDSIELCVAAFNVPKRLVWNKTKEFYGENVEGYGIQSEVLEPRSRWSMFTDNAHADGKTLSTYLGLVMQGDSSQISTVDYQPIALNPIRAFYQCWNDWFRSENFQDPYLWNHDQTGDDSYRAVATLGGKDVFPALGRGTSGESNYGRSVPKCLKKMDRFTSCLPWAQKSAAVLLPLGDIAPIIAGESYHDINGTSPFFKSVEGENLNGNLYQGSIGGQLGEYISSVSTPAGGGLVGQTNLVADLQNATAAPINQIRMAFATQRYFEALARSGSRYREYILNIYGTSIGDTTAQMSEYLGGIQININVDQVVSTADYAAGATSKLGAVGGYSVTGNSNHLFTKSVVEPGYIVIVAYTKHTRTYGQGLDDVFTKHELFDYYNPKFANLGENTQGSLKRNIFFNGREDQTGVFGFNEAWCDYRFRKDIVKGALCPSNSNALSYWNLADNYANEPTLSAEFLEEDREALKRVLTVTDGPDYICDFYFEMDAVRPMPLFSIPGLVDHF